MPAITYDTAVGQVVFFDGDLKVAILQDLHYRGLRRPAKDGTGDLAVYETLPRENWTIHFTSPVLRVEVVEAVMEALKSLPADLKRMPE